MNSPKGRTSAGKAPAPPSTRVRCKLDTVEAVQLEMARLYREGKAGTREVADVSRLANVLSLMAHMIKGVDLERRLAQLEELEAQKAEESESP